MTTPLSTGWVTPSPLPAGGVADLPPWPPVREPERSLRCRMGPRRLPVRGRWPSRRLVSRWRVSLCSSRTPTRVPGCSAGWASGRTRARRPVPVVRQLQCERAARSRGRVRLLARATPSHSAPYAPRPIRGVADGPAPRGWSAPESADGGDAVSDPNLGAIEGRTAAGGWLWPVSSDGSSHSWPFVSRSPW